MKELTHAFLFLIYCQTLSYSQTTVLEACQSQFANTFLHANDVRAAFTNIGTLFFNGNNGEYSVPYNPNGNNTSNGFLNGLWLGAKDPTGNVLVAVTGYGINGGNVDFWPGPLNAQGVTDNQYCNEWNRIWSVRKYEITQHLVEFLTTGSVQNPAKSILTWPGNGNPYFEAEMGFQLPNSPQGMAPFFDQNNDGVYNPKQGDYPRPTAVNIIPDQILWSTFNDQGGGALHGQSKGLPMKVEVQMTAWAFDCVDNMVLDRTIFASYKVINRRGEALDSLYIGLYQDSDLGCYLDDGAGCDQDLNTIFQYNLSNMDGNIPGGCPLINPDFLTNPPVTSMTLLNRPLSHFKIPTPNCFSDLLADQYYYSLQGRWITYGENGCNPSNPPTNMMFPGDPNNPNEWSMLSANVSGFNVRGLASSYVGKLNSGDFAVLDFAFGYHRLPNGTNLQNISKMYEDVSEIRDLYNEHFASACTQLPLCQNNCVWPGDADRNEIADYRDLLPVGISLSKIGPIRQTGTYYWSAFDAQDWSTTLPGGLNQKNTDCDGNGIVESSDFNLTVNHYNFVTTDYFKSPDVYKQGPEIYFEASGSTDINNLQPNQQFFLRVKLKPVPNLYGLAFQVDYDQRYFSQFSALGAGFKINAEDLSFNQVADIASIHGYSDHSKVRVQSGTVIPEGTFMNFNVKTSSFDFPLNTNQTQFKIKNIKAIREDGTLIDIGSSDMTITFPSIAVSPVEEIVADNLLIYPNPTTGKLTISLNNELITEIIVSDLFGKMVFRNDQLKLGIATLDLNDLPSGLYFVGVRSGTKSFLRKVIMDK